MYWQSNVQVPATSLISNSYIFSYYFIIETNWKYVVYDGYLDEVPYDQPHSKLLYIYQKVLTKTINCNVSWLAIYNKRNEGKRAKPV